MVDLLKRDLAPVTDEAWKAIDEQASRVLKTMLTARTLVDFRGPLGWDFAAVNLGQLALPEGQPEARWGVRRVQPLVEVRIPFTLDQMELDSISRGSKTPDFKPLQDAARQVAAFEESAVYTGFAAGAIEGLVESRGHEPLPLPTSVRALPGTVAQATKRLSLAGIPGPYALVLASDPFYALMQEIDEYPPLRVIREIVGGPILFSPALAGGVLLSMAGGNFELVVGQDLAVGYAAHDRRQVELFLTESFTFRVLEPLAVVALRGSAG